MRKDGQSLKMTMVWMLTTLKLLNVVSVLSCWLNNTLLWIKDLQPTVMVSLMLEGSVQSLFSLTSFLRDSIKLSLGAVNDYLKGQKGVFTLINYECSLTQRYDLICHESWIFFCAVAGKFAAFNYTWTINTNTVTKNRVDSCALVSTRMV